MSYPSLWQFPKNDDSMTIQYDLSWRHFIILGRQLHYFEGGEPTAWAGVVTASRRTRNCGRLAPNPFFIAFQGRFFSRTSKSLDKFVWSLRLGSRFNKMLGKWEGAFKTLLALWAAATRISMRPQKSGLLIRIIDGILKMDGRTVCWKTRECIDVDFVGCVRLFVSLYIWEGSVRLQLFS